MKRWIARNPGEVLRRSIANFQEDDVLYNLRLLPHEVLFVWGSEDRWRPIADAGLYTAPLKITLCMNAELRPSAP